MILLSPLSKRLFRTEPKWERRREGGDAAWGTSHLTSVCVCVFFLAWRATRRLADYPLSRHTHTHTHYTGLNKQATRPAQSARLFPPERKRRGCETTSDRHQPLVCNPCFHIYRVVPMSFPPAFIEQAIVTVLTASQSAGRTRAKCHFTEPLQYSTTLPGVLLESLLINSLREHATIGFFGVS